MIGAGSLFSVTGNLAGLAIERILADAAPDKTTERERDVARGGVGMRGCDGAATETIEFDGND